MNQLLGKPKGNYLWKIYQGRAILEKKRYSEDLKPPKITDEVWISCYASMENPCLGVEVGDGGELRRWRSLPVKHQNAVPPSSVATIYRPEDYGGPRQSKLPPPAHKPHATLLSALLLATLITLAATAALVCLLRAVHARYTPAAVVPATWSADMVVLGEFRVINEPYREALSNMTSADFKQLATRMGMQLENLFKESLMSDRFITASVIRFTEGLRVYCSLLLHPTDPLTVSKVGLAFLGGLSHAHGHLWLGPFIVDVQSIGFQASTDEVTWSKWSNWSECGGSVRGRTVRTRKRLCLSLSGTKTTSGRSTPCQDGSLQGITDTETELCPLKEELSSSINNFTALQSNSSSTPSPQYSKEMEKMVDTIPKTEILNNTTTKPDEIRTCANCLLNEVCVALEGELVPFCRLSIDLSDPTGCGGLCKINTEVCFGLRDKAYRCVDDSKCLENEWQCGNNLCIPLVKRCDGHFNCYDHTDEYDCVCDLKTHFHCGKNSSCLPKAKRCDGIVDCWDAADEVNCTVACLDAEQFTCNDSQCIPKKQFCDGFSDCDDHSDEPFGCGGVCKNHEWRCSNERCIERRDVCNGIDDCGDGSDEVNCGKRKNGL